MRKNFEYGMAPMVLPTDRSMEIAQILRSDQTPKGLQEKLFTYHESDISLALDLLSAEERHKLYKLLDMETLANVLEHSDHRSLFLRELSIRHQVEVLSRMEASSAVEILQQFKKEERVPLIDLMDPTSRAGIELLSSFDPDEIGSKMSTNYIVIPDTAAVKEAMSALVEQAAENDNIATLYVVDGDGTFCGAIDLKDLIIAREGTSLRSITSFSYPYVYARSLIETCIPLLRNYSEDSIPVLDERNKLIGVITAHELADVMEDELNEDYAKLAGLTAEEDLSEPLHLSVRKRLPWLSILLVMGLGISSVVGLFESIVAQLPVIMCFQSLILDMAGNVGTQSLAVAIRVLMDEQLTGKHKLALIWKESRVGFINGLLLGIMSFAAIGAFLYLKGSPAPFSFAVSGCLGAAMVLTMVVSSLSGTLIPILFQKAGVDPAVASGPLITTVNDLVAVLSYYGLAWFLLIHTFHFA